MRHIIDTHLHLWNLSQFSLPWLSEVKQLGRDFTQQNYLNTIGQGTDWEIHKAVYVEVDVAAEQKALEAEYIAQVCTDEDSIIAAAVISVDLSSPEAEDILHSYSDKPQIRGVRHVLHVDSSPKGACLEKAFVKNVQLMGELGMLFEGCLRCPELSDFTELARRCPDTQLVLDHMGNVDPAIIAMKQPETSQAIYADQWKRDIADMGELPNVSVKISGLNAFGDWHIETLAPSLEHCFDVFGEDRIMFASNYPVCQLSLGARPWLEALMTVTDEQSETFKDKLFSRNAAKIYHI